MSLWFLTITRKSNNKIKKVLKIVLKKIRMLLFSVLNAGFDVALNIQGGEVVQQTLINKHIKQWNG